MENIGTGLIAVSDTIESAITGVPAPVRKNFFKAFGQLCTAATDIPIAWLEGKSAEIRAATEARLQIIRKEGDDISQQIIVPQEYLSKASSIFAAKVIKEQVNLDQITLNAANDLAINKQIGVNDKESDDISEDWLNEFENLARLKSSDDMRFVFGKILSGEIIRPGSFSIKTIKLISQLDNEAAKLFQCLCSLVVSMRTSSHIFDARVISLGGNASANSLAQYGLSFDKLNILQEYGLIISNYNSNMPYGVCVSNEQNEVVIGMCFQGNYYGLVPTDRSKLNKELRLGGVALTKAGKELLDIIPVESADNYREALIEFFKSKHLELVELNS